MKMEKSKVDTLINTWQKMHKSLLIFLPKNIEYVIYGDNKQRPLDQQSPTSGIKWYQQVTCLWLIAFDYFCLWWLCIRVILIVFDDCFWWLLLIEFWLSLMIVFLWLFLIEFFIVYDDCLWELLWLFLMIDFDDCVWRLCWLFKRPLSFTVCSIVIV